MMSRKTAILCRFGAAKLGDTCLRTCSPAADAWVTPPQLWRRCLSAQRSWPKPVSHRALALEELTRLTPEPEDTQCETKVQLCRCRRLMAYAQACTNCVTCVNLSIADNSDLETFSGGVLDVFLKF